MTVGKDNLRLFVTTNLGVSSDGLADDTLLFSSGLLDSLSLVDLVNFIERENETRLDPMEVSIDNLDSIQQIVRFLETRQPTS